MKLIVKDVDIATGGTLVVLLNQKDASKLDLHHGDRVFLKRGKQKTVAIIDIAESRKAVAPGHIGLFEEVLDKLKAIHGSTVFLEIAKKPKSVSFIKKKLEGEELNELEINKIVRDIVENNLSEVELCYFTSAAYSNGLSPKETTYLTKAIVEHGDQLNIKNHFIVDKHCTGGIPGNRTTMIVVPICVAAGLHFPKTSSRSITSPAGTADTMEVLAPVTLPIHKLRNIVRKIGGFIAWGGGMNLATADDKLIKIRHPLSLDPQGMLLASIMAKKAAVGSTHILIDIPIGPHTKIKSKKSAKELKKGFLSQAKRLGMKIKVIFSEGKEPIGHGIGPNLEARDVLWLLKNDPKAPQDLKRKSLHLATLIFNMVGVKKAKETAKVMLESGLAYETMQKIIKAQGGNHLINPEQIKVGKFSHKIKSNKSGKIKSINTEHIAKIARIAGAPLDKEAGIYLNYHVGYKVNRNDILFIIYSDSKEKLEYAIEYYKLNKDVIIIK